MSDPVGVGHARPSGIGELLFSSRAFDEYVAMFALTDADLAGRVLDCPGGAANFAAVAGAVACDPAYTADAATLAARAQADRARASEYVAAHPDEYEWSFFADPTDYRCRRRAAGARFVRDLIENPERYVAASLPDLPFPDGAFDLVVSSHLLFSWADRLDLDFHEAAVAEMVRVCTGTVRVYPTFAMGAGPALDHAPLAARLAGRGITTTPRRVSYAFQRGEPVMLEFRRDRPQIS